MASSHFAASIKRRLPADDEGKDPRNKRKDGRSPQGFKQLCCCLHTLSRLRGKLSVFYTHNFADESHFTPRQSAVVPFRGV
uniref:Uncharacterized protein n=1 Tax=Knipowitschia caucasica TaxID=637954 RepID=A0AAV2LJ17_KNICA